MALFAAAMSCFDSGLNSVVAVIETDFLARLRKRPLSEAHVLRSSKTLTLVLGAVVMLMSTQMQYIPGGHLEVAQKTTHLFVTPLFALFFCALFTPWVTQIGAIVGAICGVGLGMMVSFSSSIFGVNHHTRIEPISFQWTGLIAFLGSVGVASIVGLAVASLSRRRTFRNYFLQTSTNSQSKSKRLAAPDDNLASPGRRGQQS